MTTASCFAPMTRAPRAAEAVPLADALLAADDLPAADDLLAADSVRLDSGARLVPPELLAPPFREENRGLLRDLAAILLDRHLRRLARMRNPVDLRIGRILSQLDRVSGWVALGFARVSDYAGERLGLPARRARGLLAMARGLETLPRLAAAFDAGDISRSQVALLLRVATPETEEPWLARARRLTVRLLEREVRAALAANAPADAAHEDAAGAPASHIPAADEPGALHSIEDDDAPPGEWIDIPVPRRLRPLWDRALELARRSSGASDPVSDCVEMIAADFLAGAPDLARLLGDDVDGADRADRGDSADRRTPSPIDTAGAAADTAGAAADSAEAAAGNPPVDPMPPDPAPHDDGTDLFEEVVRALEADPSIRRWAPPGAGFAVVLPESATPRPDDPPRVLDSRLRQLVRLRQNIAWHQGRLLRLFADRRLHRELGFLSFSRYCRERAGLGVRRAWDLISLERRLWLLPHIADAYRSGALSWVRAAAIARVATERTEHAWLRLARSVTVRRLHEEVAMAQGTVPPGLDADGRVQLSAPRLRAFVDPDHEPLSYTGSGMGGDSGGVQTSVAQDGWTHLRFWAPHDIARLWHQAMRAARALLMSEGSQPGVQSADRTAQASNRTAHAADRVAQLEAAPPPAEWECVERILRSFLKSWSVRADPTWRRHQRIFERDGWRCRVPGCTSRRNLQVHHVVFRSHGGGDEDDNLAVLCAAHHLQGIHRGRLRCHPLPDGLLAWEFAPDDIEGPLARFVEDVEWAAARAAVA